MSDSNAPEELHAKRERNREQRIEAVKRWVEYIQSEPPGTWGPQQNAVVNSQLEAAQTLETSAAHHKHVRHVADEIANARDDADDHEE